MNSLRFSFQQNEGNLSGKLEWVGVDFDKAKFKKWITEELKVLLHAQRDDLFKSSIDLSWERYISNFSVEED